MDVQYSRKKDLQLHNEVEYSNIMTSDNVVEALSFFGMERTLAEYIFSNLVRLRTQASPEASKESIGSQLHEEVTRRLDQLIFLSGGYYLEKEGVKVTTCSYMTRSEALQMIQTYPNFLLREIKVLYESSDFVAVCKPFDVRIDIPKSGSHNFKSEYTIAEWYHDRYKDDSSADSFVRFCHQLDYATSGILLLAKNRKGANEAQKQFEGRSTRKVYHALLRGHVALPEGSPSLEIKEPIGNSDIDSFKMMVDYSPGGKESHTTLRVVKEGSVKSEESLLPCTLVELELHTGRRHQLRLHTDFIGHSIMGDSTYTSGATLKEGCKSDREGAIMYLHAFSLQIDLELKSTLIVCPSGFEELLQ